MVRAIDETFWNGPLLAGGCGAVSGPRDAAAEMTIGKRIAAAALGALLLLPAATAAAAVKRPRPSDVPGAQTTIAPNGLQVYNDYASPERTYSSERVVVHYVVLGIDAPPLNDDDADGVPDYVERVGEAADRALAYYQRRGFHVPLADEGGPDARSDLYVSRCSPGTLGVAFPTVEAEGGAFAVVSNNLDPSDERSFASVYATVAHELFHLVQFSYFAGKAEPSFPTWILEGTAAALSTRANPGLDDLVSAIQLRRWFSAAQHSITAQNYGAQLLWRRLDAEQPRLLPALFRRLAARPVAGEGQRVVAATYAQIAGKPSRRRSTGSLSRSPPTTATRSSPCSASGPARRAAPASRRSPSTTSARCLRAAVPTRSPSRSRADAARLPRP